MAASLSFEQAPPFSVPVRFFLTSPLFGVAVGLLLATDGGDLINSRWQTPVLALTHLMTLGVMQMTMCGALLQILPVATGTNVWCPKLVACVSHVGLVAGTLLMAGGFLFEIRVFFRVGGPLLGATLAFYVAAVGVGLLRSSARGAAVFALRLAIPALIMTAALGVALAVALGWGLVLPMLQLTSAHAVWGLLGWSLVLVAGVAYMVVPMFHLTPPYKAGFAFWWPLAIAVLCAVWTVTVLFIPERGVELTVGWPLACSVAAFAIVTLSLQRKRRRKVVDSAFHFWRAGMLALIAAAVLGAIRLAMDAGEMATEIEFLIGILMIFGVFTALINGMLYKIVPFIVWLHLQRVVGNPPTIHLVIPEQMILLQFRLYLAALAFLIAAVIIPPMIMPAGILFAASCAWLEVNLARALLLYLRLKEGSSEMTRGIARG